MIYLLVGGLGGLLLASLVMNAMLWFTRRAPAAEWRARARAAEDRARATELRSSQQIDALLDRVSVAPRMGLQAGAMLGAVDPAVRTYVADEDDTTWNELHGEAEEDEAE